MQHSSALRKFLRGIEQVKTLRSEAEAFENRDAYVFSKEVEARSPKHLVYRCYATEREAVDDDWPLLAGEAIQNIRSALDHAVYAATTKPSNRSQFPIFLSPDDFKDRSRRMLEGIPTPIRTAIEDAQPYRRLPSAPARDPLALLRSLSNTDKHRTLTTMASAVLHEWVGTNKDITITWERVATSRPLTSGKTHVSTFTATSEREIDQMEVQPQFSYEVRIEGSPLSVFVGIARSVYRILAEVETGKPLSPLAPYPLSS